MVPQGFDLKIAFYLNSVQVIAFCAFHIAAQQDKPSAAAMSVLLSCLQLDPLLCCVSSLMFQWWAAGLDLLSLLFCLWKTDMTQSSLLQIPAALCYSLGTCFFPGRQEAPAVAWKLHGVTGSVWLQAVLPGSPGADVCAESLSRWSRESA